MPPLDHATLQAVLDKQGMPNTTENLNRIAQFAAVAPDMLEKYLGRGTDQARVDSAGGTNAAVDRSIASTADPRLAALAGPNPYTATIDPNTGLTNIGPGLVKGPAEPRGSGGGPARTQAPAVLGDLNRPDQSAKPFPNQTAATAPPPTGNVQGYDPSTGAPMPVPSGMDAANRGPPNPGNSEGNWTQYIIPSILGLFAGNVARRHMGGAPTHVPPGAVTPPISGAIPPPPSEYGVAVQPRQAPAPTTPPPTMRQSDVSPQAGAQSQADVERMRAEVEAERKAAELRGEIKSRARRSGGGGGRTAP